MTQIPTTGRIVHYVLQGGIHRMADVVTPIGPGPTGAFLVTVNVKLDSANDVGKVGGNYLSLPDAVINAFPAATKAFLFPAHTVQVASVPQDEDGHAPGTWHWPERGSP